MTNDATESTILHNELQAYETAARYGISLEGPQGHIPTEEFMSLGELSDAGGKVIKVRFIGGGEFVPGRGRCWDLSYVTGQLPDGTYIHITHLPALFLAPRRTWKGELIAWAREEGVFAKGIGLLDEENYSVL